MQFKFLKLMPVIVICTMCGAVGDPFANDPFANSTSADPFGGDPFDNAFKGSATESSAFPVSLPPKVSWMAVKSYQFIRTK